MCGIAAPAMLETSSRGSNPAREATMTTVMELSEALAAAVDRTAQSIVSVHGRPRLASTGVLWRAGLVVTASHTVESEREITLTTPDGRTLAAQLVGRDPALDVAFLRTETGATPVADVAAGAELRVGHLVLAVGTGPRASAGIVSAIEAGRGGAAAGDAVVIDLTLYPGFSGGPLVDVLGRVVGITTSGRSRHMQYAIRAAAVTRLAEQVARHGRIPRAYLGVGTQPVAMPEALRQRLGLAQETAVIAVNVRAESPAAAAGLMIGDVIVSIAGAPIAEPEDLVAVLRPEQVGQTVVVKIVRGGEPRDLSVTIGERPPRA
jgi:S1-C subfamily serine protease